MPSVTRRNVPLSAMLAHATAVRHAMAATPVKPAAGAAAVATGTHVAAVAVASPVARPPATTTAAAATAVNAGTVSALSTVATSGLSIVGTAVGAGRPPRPSAGATIVGGVIRPRPSFGLGVLRPDLVLLPGKRRAEIDVPISPTADVRADTIFEDPTVAGKRYYLPVFTLAEETVDGRPRFRMLLRQIDQAWRLALFFSPVPRPPAEHPLPHVITGILRFQAPGSVVKELTCSVQEETESSWQASLTMSTLNERDQVLLALTRPEYQTAFLVRCTVTIGVPVEKHAQTGEQLYRRTSRSVDVPLNREPFVFDPAQHPSIFAGVTPDPGRRFGVVLRQVPFDGKTHHYYQDEASPYLFYFLPDNFKLTRRPAAPFTPNMLAKFTAGDGSLDNLRVSFEYVAAPVVSQGRLDKAAVGLRAHLPSPLPEGITDPVFQPLVVSSRDQLKLSVALPRGASGSAVNERPGVVTSLTDEIEDEVADLTVAQFQQVFDALFGRSAVLFAGEVFVGGGGERPDESVPFVARLTDLHGRLLEESDSRTADGDFIVTLKNAIESPVTIGSLPVDFVYHTPLNSLVMFPPVQARVESLTIGGAPAAFPVRLSPGQELSVRIGPGGELPPESVGVQVVYDLDDVTVEPDAEAVWNAVLDASVPAEYVREIKVMAVAEMFAPTTDVLALAVDFDNGDSVVLKANALEATARVRVPVANLVLRRVQEAEYGYTLVVVRATGQTRLHKRDTLDILFPDLNP